MSGFTPADHPARIHATARRVERLLSLRVRDAMPPADAARAGHGDPA